MTSMLDVKAVVFDVGETIVDESSAWEAWAEHIGVSKLTLMATLGGTIVKGWPHRRAIELLAPGHDIAKDKPDWQVSAGDLYPDALRCLHAVRQRGYRLGVVGNQPATIEAFLHDLGVELDLVGSSQSWGVQKPDPQFFHRVAEGLGRLPVEILYVGDRVDNDIAPAKAIGMRAVLIRRGPWPVWQESMPERAEADAIVGSLDELLELLPDRAQPPV